ncbi:DUF922 domain-containing protein [Pedobacter punctiformis]|uniref:DUF922 domain-containing protein n=1 Tax=Pedobacter punctiformis TaxID=3004097 RepID=A0ABT4LF69_9SPHI|nr:DUF922 domain-containing protein [Pedobacter sp. HCMS5-2]MCZ4245808.1 DUF922 domain-containing protein [Pedobacter sp. HCMS5-2]
MKKLLIAFFIFAFPIIALCQSFTQPVQLNWETYYKGKPTPGSPFYALTAMTWHYSYESTVYRNKVVIKLKNEVNIDKGRSWVRWDKIQNESIRASLLHHEQGHVNIQFILLMEADRVLKNRTYSVQNYKAEIAEMANSISDFYDTMQKNYDEETEHGSNHKMQARWDDIIQEKMEEATANQ